MRREKLAHYGVRGKELEPFKNYLENKTQFVEIDTFRSEKVQALDASVTQGSKMSILMIRDKFHFSLNQLYTGVC